jgi:hypothetical protein
MKQLITYLRENLILDFQGDLDVETVRSFLKDDDSREARVLLAKVVADGSVDDMLVVLADVLLEPVRKALTEDTIRNNLQSYSEA